MDRSITINGKSEDTEWQVTTPDLKFDRPPEYNSSGEEKIRRLIDLANTIKYPA